MTAVDTNIDMERIPAHVAIIMDGNGRWAEKRKLPRVMGHNAGMKAMKEIVKRASVLGIKHLTVYAFSTENWKRTEEEVKGIFGLLVKYVDNELKELDENNVKVNILGDFSVIPKDALERVNTAIERTKDNDGLVFNIALNYGSRLEMIQAVREIGEKVKKGEIAPEDVDEDLISGCLMTGHLGIPDPDLLIRTSGEIRISNFLMWQIAYSEMIFTDVLWPDFTPKKFVEAIVEFQSRDRRFGGRNK
ncbi:MAG: isoprenyl transferase [Firmicutes bacterium]|nr:isoprenyl transferase [Bacillota bacterium]